MSAHGYCLIPADNIKQYQKVVKRLKKDKIEFTEDFEDEAKWNVLTCSDGTVHDLWNGSLKPTPLPQTGPAFIIKF